MAEEKIYPLKDPEIAQQAQREYLAKIVLMMH